MIPTDLEVATVVFVMAIVVSMILLFVGISVLILLHICIVGRAFRRGFVNNNPAVIETGNSAISTSTMSVDDLQKLPCYDYIAKSMGSSPVDCAVCLESFKVGEKCRLLPICKHSFHAQCVDAWLLRTPICPICRTSADLKTDGSLLVDEESSHIGGSQGVELRQSQAESTQVSNLETELTQNNQTNLTETN